MSDNDSSYYNDLSEVVGGLQQPQKIISPKYFYDEYGSKLFEDICELPEYYLTRTELGIMQQNMAEISDCVGPSCSVIEFGSGAGVRARFLLEHLNEPLVYVPVDISGDHLAAVAKEFTTDFPAIEVLPVVADFTRPFPLPEPKRMPLRNLVYFPGSTIGNFKPEAALNLLRVMFQEASAGGALIIGIDLKKDSEVLEAAYNDRAGVTAEFNLNMLRRLNREFGSDFDLENFHHQAIYNDSKGRIEMHLVSQVPQKVEMAGQVFCFEAGEAVVTEYSYKYATDEFKAMIESAGFVVDKIWTDSNHWFSLMYCTRPE